MSNIDATKVFFPMFVMHIPTLIVCLVAGVVILTRWREASSASLWALLGFGLTLILCLAMPIGQTILQLWVFRSAEHPSHMWALGTFSIVGSVLSAVTYAFLLVAVFAGRSKPGSAIPPSANHT